MNKISRKYAGLARCLALEGTPGPFTLTDDVVPVIPLSSCLDQVAFAITADAAAAIVSVDTAVLETGVYRVTWAFSYYPAVSTANVSALQLRHPNGQIIFSAVLLRHDAASAMLAGSLEINVAEGLFFRVTAGALGAGNVGTFSAVIQPL